MSAGRSDSSFDLERARAIARRLRGTDGKAAAPSGEAAPVSVPRFSAAALRGAGGGELSSLGEAEEEGDWRALLLRCAGALGADAAFITDDNGLLIASVGSRPLEEIESLAARVVVVLKQGDEMSPDQRTRVSLSIHFGDWWLTALRFEPEEPLLLTVGLVTARPLGEEARAMVDRALAPKARREQRP